MALGTDLKQSNARNFLYCLFIAMGEIAFGYPASVISVTLGQPEFLQYMGLVNAEGMVTGNLLNLAGATSGVFQAGAAVGVILTAVVLDTLGRRNAIFYNSVLGLFGGALIAGSRNISMFLAGRFFAGMSSFGFLVVTPLYTTELSPPKFRGFFVGLNAVFIGTGYSLAAWFGVAFHFADNPTTRWRGPLGMYLVWPAMMILVGLLSPESPRWLLLKGRNEQAKEVTWRLHATKADDRFAQQEFTEMSAQAEIDKTLETSWLSMFMKPSYRRRVGVTCFYCFLGQSTAILVINNYGPTFYKALGYGVTQQLLLQAGWVTVSIPMCLVGGLLMDPLGRKPIMMLGIGGCCLWLIVEACATKYFTANPTRTSLGQLGVAAFYLFNVMYQIGVDVGGNVFYSEVFPNHIRSKGVALANLVLALSDLVYLQVTPYAFANIGWRYFLVFIIISGLGFIALFWVLPETKGIPLEEMARKFGDDPKTIAVLDQGAEILDKQGESEGASSEKETRTHGTTEKV